MHQTAYDAMNSARTVQLPEDSVACQKILKIHLQPASELIIFVTLAPKEEKELRKTHPFNKFSIPHILN